MGWGLWALAALGGPGCYTGTDEAAVGVSFGAEGSDPSGAPVETSGVPDPDPDPDADPDPLEEEDGSSGGDLGGTTGAGETGGTWDPTDGLDASTGAPDPTGGPQGACGDGVVDATEACDLGAGNGAGSACTDACETNVCGDGILGPDEACDDANNANADACTNACQLPSCGDDIVQAGEQCDDGNNANTDACTNSCMNATCGDGFNGPGEACDDGDDDDDDTCSNACVQQHGGGIPISSYCTPVRNGVWTNGWEDREAQIRVLVNAARSVGRNCGNSFHPAAPPVHYDGSLTCSARNHSRDMAHNEFFSHTGTGGTTPAQRIFNMADYDGTSHAENITAGGALNTAQEAMDAWLASPSHCAALMSPNLSELGVGYYRLEGSPYVHYWTQNFGG